MTGLPTLKYEIESTTPGTWYDITAYVSLKVGESIERGRRDEESSIDASYLRLEVNNSDGRFTLGAAGYQIRTDQRIRITKTIGGTAARRFTGYVQDWPIDWLSPVGNYARCQIVATDRLARLARRDVASLVQGEILVDLPTAYYTLGEPEGVLLAGDTSGNGFVPLALSGAGTAIVFGNGVGPTDGLTAATFSGDTNTPGQVLKEVERDFPGPWTMECFFATSYAGAFTQSLMASSALALASPGLLSVLDSGKLFATANASAVTSSASVNDGLTHHAAMTMDGSGNFVLYLDGVSVGSASVGVTTTLVGLKVGPMTGTVSHVAVYPTALSAARIAKHASAGVAPDVDSTDQRIARYATYAGIATADQSLESGSTRAVAAPVDSSKMLDAMQAVATTEGGVVFIDGAGVLKFQNRNHRVFSATSPERLLIQAGDVNADDLVISADKQFLVNTITGARPDGAVQSALNAASIALYEQYPDTQTLLVTTDQEVLDSIQWQVTAYSSPRPRVSSVTVDLMTSTVVTAKAVLALELGDLIRITTLPSQSPLTTLDLIVEGWSEVMTESKWQITFNTSPAELYRAWILEDTTYGVLESTTRLYY